MTPLSIAEPKVRDVSVDIEAERSVLGILLRNNEYLDVASYLQPDYFYTRLHQLVYESIIEIAQSSGAVDPLTVYDWLKKKGNAGLVSDLRGYLFSLVDSAGLPQNLEAHARIVSDAGLLRKIRQAIKRAGQLAGDSAPQPPSQLLDAVSSLFSSLALDAVRSKPTPLQGEGGALVAFLNQLEAYGDESAKKHFVPTYINDLDRFLNGGLYLGSTYVIGARPSMGKTSLALSIMLNMIRRGWVVGFLSLEMTQHEVTGRLVAGAANCSYGPLATGCLEDADWNALSSGLGTLNEANAFIDDDSVVTLLDIEAKVRTMMQQSGGNLKVIFIDYLQLIHGDNQNRSQMLGEVSRGLKRLAKKLGIAVVELSQLNRNIDHRPDKRPVLADLRESGDIEADADVVIMPYRHAKDNPGCEHEDLADIYITKQRNGKTGWLPLRFIEKSMQFVQWDGPQVVELEKRKRAVVGGSRSRFDG
tara:strand:- start:766 stop:2187 length:1422 start_codon:yes stop_codon:yes gene_type:complete